MFASRNFLECIGQQLEARGFGAKRKAMVEEKFNGLTKLFQRQGYGAQMAQSMAMNKVFEDLAQATRERAKRLQHDLQVHASNAALIDKGANVSATAWVMDGGSGRGAGVVRAAISVMQDDPRFPGVSMENRRASLRDKYQALLGDSMDKFRKGAFGRQKGKAGLGDLVREIFGQTTGNEDAKNVASAYLNMDKVAVGDRNKAGGSMNALERYIPQPVAAASVAKIAKQEFLDDATAHWDWDRMAFPDGDAIPLADRARMVEVVRTTWAQSGANRIDPASFKGRGAAIGNSLEDHRFVHFKDADGWLFWNNKYGGDANIVDILDRHIEMMAHKTALIERLGSNPQLGIENLKALAIKRASDIQSQAEAARNRLKDKTSTDVATDKKLAASTNLQAVVQANKVIKNRLEPMFEVYSRANPMDADSPLGAAIVATSNILTAAKLGSTPLLAVSGDFAQTLAMRMLNHQSLLSGMGTYLGGVTKDFSKLGERMARAGFIFDSHTAATYATERFSPIASYGPAWSRRISDWNMRLSGLNRHTEVARATVQQEVMGALHDMKDVTFDKLPFAPMMQRYGIDADAWDAVRKNVKPWEPEQNAKFIRPLDILDTALKDKESLYQRFYTMTYQESKNAVPGATLEASVALKNTSRADTLPGAILHSFAMYKNFPITFMQMYGRLALAQESTASRIKFLAAIMGGAVIVGAMGVQMRELAHGRTPIPMDRAAFWGKAALAGGGMGIWGDFLFNGVNNFGQGPAEMAGGPLAGLALDTTNLVFGNPFKMVSAWDNEKEAKTNFASQAVNFMKYNLPGTSLWYARLALERELWDTLDQLADPHAHQKNLQKVRKQQRDYGNTYWSPPGSGITGTGPLLTGTR